MPDAPLTGPVFVAVGENGLRAVSRDGLAWSHVRHGREGEVLSTACFGGGKCVVAGRFGGDGSFLSTSDGVAWNEQKHNAQYVKYIHCVTHFKDKFIAAGTNFVLTSADGATWSKELPIVEYKVSYGLGGMLRRFANGNDLLVGVGDFARRSVSKDGVVFQDTPKPKAVDTLIDIAYGNGFFVGGGMHGLRMRSVDGLVWTDRVVGEEGEHINSIVWDGKQFVGIGQGATYFSGDGAKWERVPNVNAPTTAAFGFNAAGAAAAGGGVYIGSLWPGKIMRSTDGIKWTEATTFPDHVLALAFGTLGKA